MNPATRSISTMIKNVRYLFAKLGTTDISAIGDGTVTGAIDTIDDKLSVVGGYASDTGADAVSVANNTWTVVLQKAVTAGVFVILYGGAFETNATGLRSYSLNTNSTSANTGRIVPLFSPVSGDQTRYHTVEIFNLASAATIYFRVRQTSGSALDFYPMIKILRVK